MKNELKDKIISELAKTNKQGMGSVIDWLSNSDYFRAPASTMFHNNTTGGLAKHSWNVYNHIQKLNEFSLHKKYNWDTLAVVALLHDVCKVNMYAPNILKSGSRSDNKPWVKNDKLPIGHGEKSVVLLLRQGLELSDDEIMAIRFHMNLFDPAGKSHSHYFNDLAIMLFTADYFVSTFIDDQPKKK